MTRKDYIAIADAIHTALNECSAPGVHIHALGAIATVAHNIAGVLAADNSNFDRNRFLEACGIQS